MFITRTPAFKTTTSIKPVSNMPPILPSFLTCLANAAILFSSLTSHSKTVKFLPFGVPVKCHNWLPLPVALIWGEMVGARAVAITKYQNLGVSIPSLGIFAYDYS
jgi:hypothetical protein